MDDSSELVNNLTVFFSSQNQIVQIISLIIFCVFLRIVLKFLIARTVKKIVRQAKEAQNIDRTQEILISPLAQARVIQRTRTIGSVLKNILNWFLVIYAVIGILIILDFNSGALWASLGTIGVAVGLGSQSVVRDLLAGMFIVFEDQLGVGDVVVINEIDGVIEAVGIRTTQLRDVKGTLHYIRNGEITEIGNNSQGWSRAVVEIGVSNTVDTLKVEEIIQKALQSLAKDKNQKLLIIDPPEIWGIENFTNDQIIYKIVAKTKPTQHIIFERAIRKTVYDALVAEKIDLVNYAAANQKIAKK